MKVQAITTLTVIIGSIAATLGGASFFVSSTFGQNQTQAESVGENDIIVEQRTAMSRAAGTTHPGQVTHQIIPVLPFLEDDKIWSGTITFTASKPIELEIVQKYNPDPLPNATHGEPFHDIVSIPSVNADVDVAFTILKDLVDTHLVINGTGTISSGTSEFAGSGLLLHQSEGIPFTATYTVDAVAKDLVPVNRSATE